MRRNLFFILTLGLLNVPVYHSYAQNTFPANSAIAYVRDKKEIRLINPDGTNDRVLWAHPRPELAATQGIGGLAWRKDSTELAFSSGHEAVYSLYQSDIYAIRPGGKPRRLTNPPERAAFTRFPKGTVKVTIRNPAAYAGDQTMTVFIVYVHGAAEPQTASVGHGSSQTLTFTGVADLGNVAQPVVAMNGPFRWFSPGVDIKAGATAQTALNITGAGMRDLGAYAPLWSADGKQIGFWAGRLWRSSTKAPAGSSALQPLMKGENPPTVSAWDWGPTPALANQILYAPALAESMITGDYGIYQLTIGEQGRGLKLAEYSNSQSGETVSLAGLAWLPDGSGFLYAKESLRSALESDASGTMSVKKHAGTAVYRYQFSTKKSMLIKYLEGNAIQSLSISPDGQWIVFETGKSLEEKSNELLSGKKAVVPDLWVMRLDGSQPRLLVKNGSGPAWGVMGK